MLTSSTLRLLCCALAVSSFWICGCGDDDDESGSSCTVDTDDAGGNATIRCDDGTTAVVKSSGGSSCSVKSTSGKKLITCDDGTEIEVHDGAKGDPGDPGAKGADGADGAPGANGKDGADGMDGLDGMDGMDGVDGTNGSNGNNGNNGDAGPSGPSGSNAFVVGPGLKIAISAVTIPADLHPVVSLSIRDSADHPLDRTGNTTPGAVSVSFVLAYLSSSGGVVGEYVPYITASVAGNPAMSPVLASATQPKADSTGTWTAVDASAGTYTYRFNAAIPANYDGTKTHTLAIYSARTFEGVQYAADPIFNFRPDGQAVTEHREIVVTETCNHCHDTLKVHGGSRRDLGLCITCHVEGMQDPESGNSLEFRQMIHKIHRGKNLPSVIGGTPYKIVGYNDTVYDYSDVTFPQAMENCTTCHQGGQDSDRWKTHFSRAACTSCHDRTNFAESTPIGFTDHKAGALSDDSVCAGCHHEGRAHIAQYEVDVTKVHVPQDQYPLRQASSPYDVISEAPVLTGSIVSVTNVQTGQTPVITFNVAVNGAPYDITAGGQALSSLRFTFAGPTTDYAGWAQYTAQASSGAVGTVAATGTPGQFTWTASQTIDNIANAVSAAAGGSAFPRTGTMAVGMEGRLTKPATKPDGTQLASVNYAMHNAVFYVALTDPQAVPRRQATVVENCNTCHEDLSAHGGSRNDPEYCVMCHNAIRDTITRMPAPAVSTTATTTNLRLSHMVHRIHTGEDGVNPYIAYTPSAPLDFSEVRFPGDRRNCQHCHVPGQYELPLPDGLLASRWSDIDNTRTRVTNYYMGATAAACTGCHDAESTAVHAATMSIVNPGDPSDIHESCATCHASGKEFGLDVVHARPGL